MEKGYYKTTQVLVGYDERDVQTKRCGVRHLHDGRRIDGQDAHERV